MSMEGGRRRGCKSMIENNIKLVIWDMDDTLWKGTLSEEDVEIPSVNADCVRKLVDRGIMNSISSKNNYNKVKSKLTEEGLWELFIFPKIGWDEKGMQIKQLIRQCNLREQNVLFIDDNFHNLQEAKFVCPLLNIESPEIIGRLLDDPFLSGNEDLAHNRLLQYKILEAKSTDKRKFDSDEAFLFQSDIRVTISGDCLEHWERLLDLINRSNQLNYTKLRLTKEELLLLLNDSYYNTQYISVKDKYGDYGIVGFVAVRNGVAEHFLFSCRVIGLGVEQYVYAELAYPELRVEGEVITRLSEKDGKPKWINQSISEIRNTPLDLRKMKRRILIRGGCDLSQMEQYLGGVYKCEFNYLRYHRDHTFYLCSSCQGDKDLLDGIVKKVPFLYKNSFETEIFDKGNDIVVMSVLMDYTQAVYAYNKNHNIKVAYGNFLTPLSEENTDVYSLDELKWFFDNFTCTGRISAEELKRNLEYLRENIPGHVKLVIINGAEVPFENEDEPDRYIIHKEYNWVVDRFVKDNDNTELLDVRKFVTRREDMTDNIRHYRRNVYYQMARALDEIIYGATGGKLGVSKLRLRALYGGLKEAMKR